MCLRQPDFHPCESALASTECATTFTILSFTRTGRYLAPADLSYDGLLAGDGVRSGNFCPAALDSPRAADQSADAATLCWVYGRGAAKFGSVSVNAPLPH